MHHPRQDNTYHSLCYTSRGALAGTRNTQRKTPAAITWSTHFNSLTKEANVLFNDTLNTFYLQLYSIRHIVKDHSDSRRGNPLPPHGLLFLISSKGSFICTIPDRIAHTTAFVTPVLENWLEREIH